MRSQVLTGAILVAAMAAPTTASGKDGDHGKAARLLGAWRFEEARPVIGRLAAISPDSPQTLYLRAELEFLDGHYGDAEKLLVGLDGEGMGGSVGLLRSLARKSAAVTKNFDVVLSHSGHFEIHYPPGKDKVIVDLAGDVLEAAHDALAMDLGYRPPEPIRVELLGDPADLAQLSTLTESGIETTGTIALCKYAKLMVVSPRATVFGYPWMDTLTHEYVHYVVSRMSHDRVPVWLHEGLARYLQVRWRGPATGKLTTIDTHLLAEALKKDSLIDFQDMHPSMAKLPSQQAATLAFAEVLTMVQYLHGRVGNDGLRDIIESHRGGEDGRALVATAAGTTWKALERDWKKDLQRKRLNPSPEVAARAKSRRIRFVLGDGAAERDTDNVGIDEVSSKKARRHTRLAGLLRARGRSDAAALEYETALAIVGPGDPFVAAKLSRTYLELQRYPEAIALAQPLLAADEHDASPATTLGAARLATGDHRGAADAFEFALRVSPFDPSVRCGLAEAYGQLGDKRSERESTACQTLR